MSYAYVVIEQPAGTFYVTAMPASEVVRISKAKPRIFNPETLTSEGGIQREPSERRIKAISDYVATTDAAFPTAVLLAVKSEDCVLQDGQISIAGEGVADIVDGQHRVEGLRCSPKTDVAKFTLPIVFIIDSTEGGKGTTLRDYQRDSNEGASVVGLRPIWSYRVSQSCQDLSRNCSEFEQHARIPMVPSPKDAGAEI